MIIALILLLLLTLLPLLHALRLPKPVLNRADQDIDFHKATLKEIESLAQHGQLAKADASSLALDVQRRILRVRRDGAQDAKSFSGLWLQLGCALAICAAAGGWVLLGNRQLPEQSAQHAAALPATDAQLGAALERLNQNPADEEGWLALSERFLARRETAKAVEALSIASAAMPDRVSLWVALGQALFLHGEGQMSPAARYAFDRAVALDPDHPGPKIFTALAFIQEAQPQKALPILVELEAKAPKDAPWRPRVERMLRGTRTMIAAGVGTETR